MSSDPESVVQRQLDAFDARDIDALLAVYAEDAQMFEHPSTLLASGSAAFRERYTARFQEPKPACHCLEAHRDGQLCH